MSLVTCITVTYGPTPSLVRTVESLVRHRADVDQDIVVVSQPDASGRRENVLPLLDRVTHLALADNIGFGPANGHAVERCDSEYVAFVNPDLVVTEGWAAPLIRALEDDRVAIAAPPLLGSEGELQEAGQAIFADGGTEAIGGARWPADRGSVMFSRDVDYASAACWMMRRETFVALGGFDARFAPAFFEDSDLSMTAWTHGLATRLVVDRPVIHHHEGADATRVALAEASRSTFEAKWADRLAEHPRRDAGRFDARRVRDHRASRRLALIFEGAADSEDLVDVARTAAAEAEANPRARVTLVVPRGDTVERLRRAHRSAGLEVLEVDAVRRADVSWATEVRDAGR